MRLPQLAPDKAQHVVYGAGLAVLGHLVWTVLQPWLAVLALLAGSQAQWAGQAALVLIQPWLAAVAAGVTAGWWKERRDRRTGTGEPSRADFLYTAGAAAAVALVSATG